MEVNLDADVDGIKVRCQMSLNFDACGRIRTSKNLELVIETPSNILYVP